MANLGGALDSIISSGILSTPDNTENAVGRFSNTNIPTESNDIYFGENTRNVNNIPDIFPKYRESVFQQSTRAGFNLPSDKPAVVYATDKIKIPPNEVSNDTIQNLAKMYGGGNKFHDINGTFNLRGKEYKEYPITDDIAKSELGADRVYKGTKLGWAQPSTIGFGIDIRYGDKKGFIDILQGMGKSNEDINGVLSARKKLTPDEMLTASTRYISKYRQDVFEPFLNKYNLTNLSESNQQKMFNLFYRGDISTSSKSPYKRAFFNMFADANATGREIQWTDIQKIAKAKGIPALYNRVRNVLNS